MAVDDGFGDGKEGKGGGMKDGWKEGWRRKGADDWRLMYGAYTTSGSSIFLNLVQIRST